MQAESEEKIEIKQVSERELWIGKSRFYFGEDNIFQITLIGEGTEEASITAKNFYDKYMNTIEGKVNILADLNKTGKGSSRIRKRWKELSEHEKTGKIALFGLHPVARVLASFFMGSSRNQNTRFFKTKEDAITWLKK